MRLYLKLFALGLVILGFCRAATSELGGELWLAARVMMIGQFGSPDQFEQLVQEQEHGLKERYARQWAEMAARFEQQRPADPVHDEPAPLDQGKKLAQAERRW